MKWPFVTIYYKYGDTTYHIKVYQEEAGSKPWHGMDNLTLHGSTVELQDDGSEHEVEVHCGMVRAVLE